MAREIVTSENREDYMKKKLGIEDDKSHQIPIYHGTSEKNAKDIEKKGFNVKKSADGTIWFSSHPEIGEVAASGKGKVIKRYLDKNKLKLGGWNETDKYSTDELINQGYHGLELPRSNKEGHTFYQIFHPEKLIKRND
jgi:hypothetical protein